MAKWKLMTRAEEQEALELDHKGHLTRKEIAELFDVPVRQLNRRLLARGARIRSNRKSRLCAACHGKAYYTNEEMGQKVAICGKAECWEAYNGSRMCAPISAIYVDAAKRADQHNGPWRDYWEICREHPSFDDRDLTGYNIKGLRVYPSARDHVRAHWIQDQLIKYNTGRKTLATRQLVKELEKKLARTPMVVMIQDRMNFAGGGRRYQQDVT